MKNKPKPTSRPKKQLKSAFKKTPAVKAALLGKKKKPAEKTGKNKIEPPDNANLQNMKRELRETKERLLLLSEAAEEGIAIHDKGVIIDANDALARIFGYELSEIIGMKAEKLATPESWKVIREHIATGYDKPYEGVGIKKDGSTFICSLLGKLYKYKGRTLRLSVFRDITERKSMEEKLRFEEQRFRSFIEHSSDIIVIMNREGVITYVNPAVERALGFKVEERIGAKGFERIHPDDLKFLTDAFNTLAEATNAPVLQSEIRLRHKDGSWRTFEAVGSNLAHNNVVETVIVNYRDITERKQVEEALRQSEKKYRIILENIQEVYFEVDLAGNFTFFNDSVCRVLQYSRKELMDMNNRQYTDKEELKKVFKAYNKVYKTGKPLKEFGYWISRKDGVRRYVEGSVSLLKNSSGKPTGFRGIMNDFSERKQAEEKLRESEKQYRTFFKTSRDCVFITSIDGSWIDMNDAAVELFGYSSRDELMRVKIPDLYAKPEDRTKHISTIIEQGNTRDYPVDLLRKDGKIINTLITSAVRYDADGKTIGLMGTIKDITDRKRAEDALHESEEKYRSIFENTGTASIIIEEDTTIALANAEWVSLSGYSREENEGKKKWTEFVVPEDLERMKEYHRTRRINEFKAPRKYEFRFIRRNGEIRDMLNSVSMIPGTNKSIASLMDITERKRAEENRLTHMQFFENMDKINLAILETHDLEQMMSSVLKTMVSIFDCDRSWLLYPCDPDAPSFRVPMEITKPEYPGAKVLNVDVPMSPGEAQNMREALESDAPVTYTAGTERPICTAKQFGVQSQMFVPLYPKLGKPWVLGMHQCSYPRVWALDEKRLFQEIGRRLSDALTSLLIFRDLYESEERYRLIAENTADTIAILNLNLNTIYVSPSVLKLRGYTVQEAMTQSLNQILTPESQQKANELFTEQLALESNGKADPSRTILNEFEEYCKDGSTIWVELVASFLRDNNFKPTGILIIARNITERKRAEEELKQYREHLEELVRERTIKLEASNKELEAFSYSASHDLRAPLRTIDGFSQALLEDCEDKLDIQGKDYLIRIRAATRRMAELIEDLLQLSRITRTEMNIEKVNLTRIARSVIDELQKSQPQRHIEIKIADGLEDTADSKLMRIVLENLLGNAWKFTEKQAKAVIEFGLTKEGKKKVYFIRDNGAGFDMAYADKLFAPFQRLHTEEEFPGTGIGLATVRRIIHRHGGNVWTEGETGKGATFYFSLNE